jgi:hypothetical protein
MNCGIPSARGSDIPHIIVFGSFVIPIVVFLIAVQRFAAHQRRLGRWDEYGPLEETQGPPHSMQGGQMSERLEVVGKWKGQGLQRRQPHEPPRKT